MRIGQWPIEFHLSSHLVWRFLRPNPGNLGQPVACQLVPNIAPYRLLCSLETALWVFLTGWPYGRFHGSSATHCDFTGRGCRDRTCAFPGVSRSGRITTVQRWSPRRLEWRGHRGLVAWGTIDQSGSRSIRVSKRSSGGRGEFVTYANARW